MEKPLLLPTPRHLEMINEMLDISASTITCSGVSQELLDTVNSVISACPPVSLSPETNHKNSRDAGYPNQQMIFRTEQGGGHNSKKSPCVSCHLDPHLKVGFGTQSAEESYILKIRKPGNVNQSPIQITGSSYGGIRYGLCSLAQLIRQYGKRLPILTITDAPSFRVRGVMLDISRDRVPRQDELLNLVDLLASWKINHLQLYTEHTFAYIGHEEVWREASPMTPNEVQELDQYCRNRGIVLAANQNCFGHMQRWLKHDRYAHLAETHDTWDFNGQLRSGPFSLCPIDPASIVLIEDLLNQLLPNFSSDLVNIGCDETLDVGQGRSRKAVEDDGIKSVYAAFVEKVAHIVRRHGFRPMIWADFLIRHGFTGMETLPGDYIYLVWGYEHDTPFRIWCDSLHADERDVWVCPGTSAWRSITGRSFERHANIVNAASEGSEAGASGFMITEWGDSGHSQQLPITIHALAEAANAAWNSESAPSYNPASSALHAFGDKTGDVSRWLGKLGDVDLDLRQVAGPPDGSGKPEPLRNATCLFTDLHTPFRSEDFNAGNINDWHEIGERLSELADSLPKNLPDQLSDELNHTLNVARFAAERALLRRKSDKPSSNQYRRLAEWMRKLIAEHRLIWLLRSRPGGLDDSCRYYQAVLEELELQ